jgi:hypothetical protein
MKAWKIRKGFHTSHNKSPIYARAHDSSPFLIRTIQSFSNIPSCQRTRALPQLPTRIPFTDREALYAALRAILNKTEEDV